MHVSDFTNSCIISFSEGIPCCGPKSWTVNWEHNNSTHLKVIISGTGRPEWGMLDYGFLDMDACPSILFGSLSSEQIVVVLTVISK